MKYKTEALPEAVELPLMEDQEMIQAFSPHAAQKTFAESICEGAFGMAFAAL